MPSENSIEFYKSEVKALLVEVSNLPGLSSDKISDDISLFHDGLGLDSIDILELVVALDKRYAMKIRNDDGGHQVLRNVNSIAEAIHQSQFAPVP